VNSVGYTSPIARGGVPSTRRSTTRSTIAPNRVSRCAFGSAVPGETARRLSTTASASPVGVSQLSSLMTYPSGVANTSARAMPCHSGRDAFHMSCW
jgi:hypothetical protein